MSVSYLIPLMNFICGFICYRGCGSGCREHCVRLCGLWRTEHDTLGCRPLLLQLGQNLAMTGPNTQHGTSVYVRRRRKHSKYKQKEDEGERRKKLLYNWFLILTEGTHFGVLFFTVWLQAKGCWWWISCVHLHWIAVKITGLGWM